MWNQLIRKHCTDEELLAYADGELSPVRYSSVKKHLALCWQCRNRLGEIEAQTQAIVRMLRDDTLPGPERTALARSKFLVWQQEFERDLVATPQIGRSAASSYWVLAIACALILVVASGVWFKSSRHHVSDSEILARTETADETLVRSQEVVHQTFQIRVVQIEPTRRESTGKIEVWSYSHGLRFASRWSDSKGVLQQAVWHSSNDPIYVYNPTLGPGVVALRKSPDKVRSLLDLFPYTADVGRFQSGIMEWLQTRDWRPIALSSDIRTFTSQDGATLRVEHVDGGLCLQAERVIGGVDIKVSLQLDAKSYEPRLQTIRFESQGHVMEVQLVGEGCTFVNPSRIAYAVFEPHLPAVPVAPAPIPAPVSGHVAESERSFSVATPNADIPNSNPASLVGLEMEVRYALHRLRVCLGEPTNVIEVTQNNVTHLEVRGLVETQTRKEELTAALAEFPSVIVSLGTAEEARKTSSQRLQPQTSTASPQQESELRLANRSLPIRSLLEGLFPPDRSANNSAAQQNVANLTTRAVSLSQGALTEAWALRHLAERYSVGDSADLPPESRWLLEVMFRDHMRDLQGETASLETLLGPVLAKAPGSSNDSGDAFPEAIDPTSLAWKRMVMSVFFTSQQINNLVQTLFAGSDPPPVGLPQTNGGAPGTTDAEQVNKAIQELDTSILLQKSRFDWFEAALQNAVR